MGQPNYVNGFEVAVHEKALPLPLTWKRSQTIFVNSMSDLYHKNVSRDFILKVFGVMNEARWHRFQILTKRAGRLAQMNTSLPWAENIWFTLA